MQIRWLIRRDLPEILAIERMSFEFAWTKEDFLFCLKQRNCMGMVAEHDQTIVGFMMYKLRKSLLDVINFAIHPDFRRLGVGTQMVDKLINKLSTQIRSRITLEVRETNLKAQLFFREQGLRAEAVLRNNYEDTGEDGYLMVYDINQQDL